MNCNLDCYLLFGRDELLVILCMSVAGNRSVARLTFLRKLFSCRLYVCISAHLQIVSYNHTQLGYIYLIFCNWFFFITHTYWHFLLFTSWVTIHIYLISCLILVFWPYLSSFLHDTGRNMSREKTASNIKYVALQDVICQHLIGNEEVTSVGGRNIQVLLQPAKNTGCNVHPALFSSCCPFPLGRFREKWVLINIRRLL